VPRIEARGGPVRVEREWLARFQAEAGGTATGVLPLLAPQLFAGPLHAALLADPAMPVGVLGLVHVTNRVIRHRALAVDEPLALECWVEGQRPARRGAELDLHTVARVDGEPVWEATTTALARGPWGDPALASPPPPDPFVAARTESWQVPEDAGRRWRRVSGDPNPIHLHALAARPFGFPRAIAHGTWLLARALTAIGEPDGPAELEVRFRRPVSLPSAVELRIGEDAGTTPFSLVRAGADEVHLTGWVSRPG
jgi:hypothetical protein